LRKIISGKIKPGSTVYSDNWRGYNGLLIPILRNIIGSTTVRISFPEMGSISMTLSHFGLLRNTVGSSSRELKKTSTFTLKSASGLGENATTT